MLAVELLTETIEEFQSELTTLIESNCTLDKDHEYDIRTLDPDAAEAVDRINTLKRGLVTLRDRLMLMNSDIL